MTTSPEEIDRALPFTRYEFHTVNFLEPGQDIVVAHGLNPENPDQVGYMVVSKTGDGVISDARTSGGTPWSRSTIALRSSLAPSSAVLLLVLLKGF